MSTEYATTHPITWESLRAAFAQLDPHSLPFAAPAAPQLPYEIRLADNEFGRYWYAVDMATGTALLATSTRTREATVWKLRCMTGYDADLGDYTTPEEDR